MVEPEPNVPVSLRKYIKRLQDSFPMAVAKRFIDVDVLTQAASVSFYALLSMAPLLVLLLWLTASLYPPAQQALIDQISSVAGSSAATVAETVLKNADNQPDVGSLAGVWSTLLLFVGATAVFAQLQNALNLIFRTSGERLEGLKAWLRKRVFSFGVVLALGFLLILSMTATTVLQVAFAQLPSILPALGYVTSRCTQSASPSCTTTCPTVAWRGARPSSAASSPRHCSHWAGTASASTSPPWPPAVPTARWARW